MHRQTHSAATASETSHVVRGVRGGERGETALAFLNIRNGPRMFMFVCSLFKILIQVPVKGAFMAPQQKKKKKEVTPNVKMKMSEEEELM